MGGPARCSDHPVFAIDFENVSPNQSFVRGRPNEPHTAALKVGAAMKVAPRNFQMLGTDGELEVSLMGRGYEFRALGEGPIQADGKRHWSTGVRLGPQPSGGGSSEAEIVERAPPALREISVRELVVALSSPERVGCPPTINSDASWVSSCVGYQGSEADPSSREAGVFPLVRLAGTAPHAPPATKQNLAQRAKSGLLALSRQSHFA